MLTGHLLNARMQAQEDHARAQGLLTANLWDQFPQVKKWWAEWCAAMACDLYEAAHKEWCRRKMDSGSSGSSQLDRT